MSGFIYPTFLFISFRVGLIHTSRGAAMGIGSRGRMIDRRRSRGAQTTEGQSNTCFFKASYNGPIRCNVATSHASIAWNTDHQTASTHVLNRKRYNGPDQILEEASRALDEDPTDGIQGVL